MIADAAVKNGKETFGTGRLNRMPRILRARCVAMGISATHYENPPTIVSIMNWKVAS